MYIALMYIVPLCKKHHERPQAQSRCMVEPGDHRTMTEPTDWHAQRERLDRFHATELGKLYRQHHHALIDYWRRDADDSAPDQRLRELDERTREATNAFVTKLMELAGV